MRSFARDASCGGADCVAAGTPNSCFERAGDAASVRAASESRAFSFGAGAADGCAGPAGGEGGAVDEIDAGMLARVRPAEAEVAGAVAESAAADCVATKSVVAGVDAEPAVAFELVGAGEPADAGEPGVGVIADAGLSAASRADIVVFTFSARSTFRSSRGISATMMTDSDASVANARLGLNQLASIQDRQPVRDGATPADGFVAGCTDAPVLATDSRASARIRASAAADGCNAAPASAPRCVRYSALSASSAGSPG
jgi:hypothetical protein